MISSIIGFSALGFSAIAVTAIGTSLHRNRKTSQSTNPASLADRLYPFVEDGASLSNIEIWRAMGGLGGLARMNLDALGIAILAKGLGETDPLYTEALAREMRQMAVCLWFGTWIALIESMIIGLIPILRRKNTLLCAWLYCEMTSSFDVLREFADRAARFSL